MHYAGHEPDDAATPDPDHRTEAQNEVVRTLGTVSAVLTALQWAVGSANVDCERALRAILVCPSEQLGQALKDAGWGDDAGNKVAVLAESLSSFEKALKGFEASL